MRIDTTSSVKYGVTGLLLVALLLGCAGREAVAQTLAEQPQWGRHFTEAGVVGTMVLQKDGSPDILVFDAKRAATPYLPASTFKILNSLIGLETGAIKGPDEVFPYDGTPRFLHEWNKDLTLKQAFAVSCVPVYQEIARRIGQDRMAWYVAAAGYGNADISGGIDVFWLSGGLRISALEQIAFLTRLKNRQLPFSAATIDAVLDIMIAEKTPAAILRAKTGWSARVSPGIAWYVGMVTRGPDTWYFALNIDVPAPADTARIFSRQVVAKAILHEEGLL
ncbi:MAG: class D beta-lactamase [Solidesulfovibrio sp.]